MVGKHLIRLKGPQEQSETLYPVEPGTASSQKGIWDTAGRVRTSQDPTQEAGRSKSFNGKVT